MDGLKPGRGNYSRRPHVRPSTHAAPSRPTVQEKTRHSGEKYWLVRSIGRTAAKQRKTLWRKFQQTEFAKWPDRSILNRVFALTTLVLFIVSTLAATIQPFLDDKFYTVTKAARSVLPEPSQNLGNYLKYNAEQKKFLYNEGYTGSTGALSKTGQGEPRISAAIAKEPSDGITVTDALNKIDFTIKPKFSLDVGKQDRNQIFYPLTKATGYLVYTSQTASIKEDIVLEKTKTDRLAFEYELDLANGLEARLEDNGSIGIYGTSLPINGNVATGSEKDAQLLQKTRENAKKDKFLFGIPAPVVVESGKEQSSVRTYFKLDGNKLAVIAEGLEKANYPLSIDPSVYVQSAAQLMRGNNETNVEFDVATEQFKKGTTTGARIDEWTETGAMNDATYDQAVAAAGGYVYKAGGRSGRVMPWIASQKETTSAVASTNHVISMPDVRPAGDLYIALLAYTGTANEVAPAGGGWTEYADTFQNHAAYYKLGTDQGGGNEASSYTWTGGNVQFAGVILRIKNFDPATLVSNVESQVGSGTGTPTRTPAITPNDNGSLIIGANVFSGAVAPTSGYSPTDYTDVASGNTTPDGSAGPGYMVTSLDSPPASGVAIGQQFFNGVTGHSNWGASAVSINGITASPAYQTSVQWAHFNGANGAIDSPAPGSNGTACANWCTDSAYNLPTGAGASTGAGNIGAAMVAYNGYLYYIGGSDGTNVKDTVYIAKLGAKGEPSLWHPSDPDQVDWVYWYKHTSLSSARAYHSLSAHDGKMYILGGDTNLASYNSGALTTVETADILPNGTLGTWSSGQALTGGARYGASVQAYNGYLYILGGNNNGTMLNLAQYSRLNADGSMNSWQTAGVEASNTFTTARASKGGQISGIWGGYIYLAGGCTAVNTTGNGMCTSIASDVQLASINADGTLDNWNTMANIRHQRFGSSFIAWQDNLYRFGGCSKQDTATDTCYGTHIDVQYGSINQDGDASTVSITQANGAGLCVDPDPYDCNLPPAGDSAGQGGHMLSGTAILNGYLYVIGGCTTFDNSPAADADCASGTAASGNVSYAAISSDGKLKRPPTCPGTDYGSWCVDSTNQVNGTGGVAAPGIAIFGGFIYVIGGLTGTANLTNIYRNSTSADGSLSGAWQSQTFANLAITYTSPGGGSGISYTFAYARANPSNATYPGNLYIFGGCGASNGAGCTQYQSEVFKCNILASGALEQADANDCDTAGQMQIDVEAAGGVQGLGIHAGAVYANYIYLIGGVSAGAVDRKQVFYAKFDNSNNVVDIDGESVIDNIWTQSPVELQTGRRRGTAFGYNGYLYAVGGFEATINSALDTIEFVKINVSDGSLESSNNLFSRSAVTINQRWGLSLAVSNSYAYIIGGCNVGGSPNLCSSFDPTIQTFQVYNNNSGAPGGYTTSDNTFATDRIGGSAAVLDGYMYIAGGCTSNTDCGTTTTNVQKALIDANGELSTAWTATGVAALPAARSYGQLEVAGNTLYYLGGETGGTAQSTVYYATMGASGAISSWSTASGGIGDTSGQAAVARTKFSSAVWNNRIYVTGGYDGAARSNHVYISPQLNGGNIAADSWTGGSGSGFNVAREGQTAITYANNLYILGGYNGTSYFSDVQFTQINSDGSLDSWTYSTNLPVGLQQADGFAVNGYMYIFGGRSSTNDCSPRTLVAPISANTTVASGNNPTGIGEWYETNRKFDSGRYGAAAVYHQGKAYVLGGGCQGVVMQDDFDPGLDATMWANTTGMTVGTTCQSTSTSNVMSTNSGGAATPVAETNYVDVDNGGTIYFKIFTPAADGGGCFAREANTFGGNPDNVRLEWSTSASPGVWGLVATYAYTTDYDPFVQIAVAVPVGAETTAAKFRWIMPTGEANDSYAIEDVSIVATGNTTVAYAPGNVTQTTLLSQPQIANYSRLVDAGKDVFPTKFLMNGLDNSIGARWQMSYRSMNDPTVTDVNKACGGSAMTAYGALTNFGDVTLGTPGTYTVKNGAGTNIACSRYFLMNISIDASKTYGYPEDINRGPTLDNLTLFFKSNPGQRLLHGKTFIEGTQQPLDTQPGP